MKYLRITTSVLLLSAVISVSPNCLAQTTRGTIQKQSKPTPSRDTDPEFQQRRSTAISLLQSLAIEARSFRDEALRARVQARIADVLWDHDRDTARALFRRAWEIAEAFDQGSGTSANLSGRRPSNRPTQAGANLRREVLQLTARRDHALGEEFLSKLTSKNQNQSTTATTALSGSEITERLRLAHQFLETDNLQRALQFADPALTGISSRSIQFLNALRDKNAVLADQHFARLLSVAGADTASDANTVSLLTSYAFTPWIYLVVSRTGIPSSNSYVRYQAPDLAASLKRKFFEIAASILVRPLQQVDQSSAGRAGTFFIASRLLPLFQRFAPDLVAPINAQLAAMGPEAASTTATYGDLSLNRGMNENGGRIPVDDELKDRLDRARDAAARDRAYAHAAMSAADQADPRAREFVDKIEDAETRKGIGMFVDYNLIGSLIRKKEPVEALRLIRKSELTHVLRANFLRQVAALTAKDDRVRSMELLNEALVETRRIDAGSAERAYCLVGLLLELSKLDRTRTWELLSETVKAANSLPDFTGEDGHTSSLLEGKFSIQLGTQLVSPTDLSEVFEHLAQDSFYQAIDVSKTFTGDAPKALATIAITKAVLNPTTDTRR